MTTDGRAEPLQVLIVENHALMREGIRNILERHGLDVVGEAADGIAAVDLTERLSPDVVLMDISMPRLNGIAAVREIKDRCPETAVLMLTMHEDETYVFAALEAGAAGYLLKTADSSELVGAIESVAAGESVLSPEITRTVLTRFISAREQAGTAPRPPLTERELGILKLAANGLQNRAIAEKVGISPRTVQLHLTSIFDKLEVGSRTEAVIAGLKRGWLRLEDID